MTSTAFTWHTPGAGGLRGLTTTAGSAGIVLGRQHSGDLAPVRLFRPEPTRVTLVGGLWLEALVVFRCLGAGARVEITTAAPGRWSGLGERAGAPGLLVIAEPAHDRPATGAPAAGLRPVLRVTELAPGGGAPTLVQPWESALTVVSVLTPTAAASLDEADVVVLQRLAPQEAELCVSTLRLAEATATKLQQMHEDMLVVVTGGGARYLWFATTAIEEEALGPPRRGDPVIRPVNR